MANTLPPDAVGISGIASFEPEAIVYGSISYNPELQKTAVTTADGLIHNIVTSIGHALTFQVYGDNTDISDEAPALSQEIAIYSGGSSGTEIATFYGTISVEYDESSRTSTITITGDPT